MFKNGKNVYYINEVFRLNFIDKKHEQFYIEKLNELSEYGKTDVYYKSLVYTLGICETTRQHFKEIFNVKQSEVNLDSIQGAWQTGTSSKVTRMAFNLWNHNLMYDSEEDLKNEKISNYYAPSEIFCCSYAPYFWEAIKIRYPEYIEYEQNSKRYHCFTYCKVENKEQIENYEKVGIYIRNNSMAEISLTEIMKEKEMLDKYCNENAYNIIKEYIDQGYSALDNNRPALNKMLDDIKTGEIDVIVVRNIATLFREPIDMVNMLEQDFMEDIQIRSLDGSVEDFIRIRNNFYKNKVQEALYKNQGENQEENDEII